MVAPVKSTVSVKEIVVSETSIGSGLPTPSVSGCDVASSAALSSVLIKPGYVFWICVLVSVAIINYAVCHSALFSCQSTLVVFQTWLPGVGVAGVT